MHSAPSPIWRRLPPDVAIKTQKAIQQGLVSAPDRSAVRVFFRADDVAVPGRQFMRLMALFERRQVPLSPAIVPAWLTAARWRTLTQACAIPSSDLWCWHHHGWRHLNHERVGKKQEFGAARSDRELKSDLIKGRERLQTLLGNDFYPVFTPPWNRCDHRTLMLLEQLGYVAVSRSRNSQPPAPDRLPDFQVNVDLHTRRELNWDKDWNDLPSELSHALAGGLCGIMLHHQRMNDAAFDFLELLLEQLRHFPSIQLLNLKHLVLNQNHPSGKH